MSFKAVEYIDSLVDAGVEPKQAKVMAQVMANTIDNLAKENHDQIEKMAKDKLTDVATKQDIRLLERENVIVRWMLGLGLTLIVGIFVFVEFRVETIERAIQQNQEAIQLGREAIQQNREAIQQNQMLIQKVIDFQIQQAQSK